jgi:tetratricopeptide (TPR) repeat protein
MSIPTPVFKRIALILGFLTGSLYLALVSSQYLAFRFSKRADFDSLRMAVRLQPGNAEYRFQLGEYYSLTQQLQEAVDSYGTAVALNSNESGYWIRLAAADDLLGFAARSRAALQNALAVDPKNPNVAWAAGNFFVTEGDVDSGLKEFRVVLENSPVLAGPALELCWQLRPDVDSLLRDAIPPNSGNYSSFLEFLMSKGDNDSAAKVWGRMAGLHQTVSLGVVFDYVHYLIGRNRPQQARTVWLQASDLANLKNYQTSSENVIANANFSFPILNGGFDWSYEKRSDVTLALDPTEPHLGSPSLLISYDSRGLEDSGIGQLISVEPGTRYQFSAFFKTQSMQGAGGPHFILHDFYSDESLFTGEELKDSAGWGQVTGEFKTGPETRLLRLRISRVPAGSPIRGKLWIDNVRLQRKQEVNAK